MSQNSLSSDWVRECSRRVIIGAHFPDYDQAPEYAALVKQGKARPILADFNAKVLVRELKKAGVQAFYFYNKCHRGNAYYPSQVPGAHVHSALTEKGDIFGQLCEVCLSEGITPLTIYEFSDLRMPTDHPDWCHQRRLTAAELRQQKEAGGRQKVETTDGQEGSRTEGPCLNGPYGEFAIAQACETVKNYPVEGYFVDFLGLFTFGNWICPYCAPRFKKDLGFEFKGIENMTSRQRVDYIRWHYAQNAAYIDRMRRALEVIRPGLVFVHNFHGGYAQPGLQTWKMAHELTTFVTGDLFSMRAGQLQLDWKLRGYVAASRQKPAEVLLDTLVAVGGDNFTPKALDSYRAEIWTARSQNVSVMSSIMPSINGECFPEQLALIKKVFDEQTAYEPWLRDMQPEYTVGVLRSAQTLEFMARDETQPPGALRHELDFQGWCQALIQGHFLWDVVHDHLVNATYLKRFATLILPDAACLSNAQCAAIKSYVRNGGRLIATGETSLNDECGAPRANFALSTALGVRLKRRCDPVLNRMQITDRSLKSGQAWVTNRLAYEFGQCAVRAVKGGRILGAVFSSVATPLINTFLPLDLPGILHYNYGNGAALYFAGCPGLHYRMFGVDTWRRLMVAAVMRMGGKSAMVTLEAPGSVGLYVYRQAGEKHCVANLVNWIPDCCRLDGRVGAGFDGGAMNKYFRFGEVAEMPPVVDAVLYFHPPRGKIVQSVYLAPDRRSLRIQRVGRAARVIVPKFSVHAMVVAEMKNQ